MAKKKSSGWLDKYQVGGPIDPFGLGVAKKDAVVIPKALSSEELKRIEANRKAKFDEEVAKRKTYINPVSKTSTAPAMRQAAEDRIAQEKANAFTKKIAEGAQTIGGALELAAPFTGPFMPIVGGVGAGLGIGSSAYLAGKDAMAGNYGSAALNAGFGALDVAGFAALRNPAVKDFVQGADHVSDYSQVVDLTGIPEDLQRLAQSNKLTRSGIPNPLAMLDQVIPRPDPIKAMGVEMDIMDLSPLNLIPGYGKNLSGKNQTFRKFGNSLDDVIQRQALSPAGGSDLFRMGKNQIVSEGNWAARNQPSENYPGVFEATFDMNNPNANLSALQIPDRNGVLMVDRQGRRLPEIPLTEPGMSFNRRLPFSTRYVPIDKTKLMNNEFQLATQLPYFQSLAEKYGLYVGGAGAYGYLRGGEEGAKEKIDLVNKYTIDPVLDLFKEGDMKSTSQNKNGGWLEKYNDGGPVQPNYNDYSVSAGPGFEGDGYSNVGRNYSPAWGGQFQMGGSIGGATQGIPGATGFMYARTGSIPSNGKYAKKTKASAQKGRKVPKELTETEIYEKETKEREAAEAALFEKYSREIEKAEAVRVAEELAKSEAFREEESRKRSERDKGRNRIDFDNLKTTQQVNDYLSYMLQENQNKIDKSGVSTIKKNIIDYINSPTYAKRQANFPEQYIGGEAERYQKNKYESTIAKNKREQRISNLSTTPVVIDKKGDVNELNYFDPKLNKVILSEKNMPEVVAHELTHAATQKGERQLIDSDNVNAKYWDSVVAKSKKLPISTRLNRGEMDKFIELAREADESGARDIHADKNTNEVMFTDEQYGDLMGVRSLLYKSGITKSFGEQLDKTKMDKALNDKKIKASPVFKRLLFRYGSDNVINLNNTIAANNPQQGMPMAQNGMEMKFYQEGLDFKPKTISKNGGWLSKYEEGGVIKDDMGQWDHPGEITEIGSNQITMQGVPYPVLGISDTGDTQMMYPDEEYEYDGESVTEYPMMKQGGQLTKLDQLSNFTNYNTKQPGGWLDKYQ
jgi:adenylate kinase family enzyme